ncbi:hypothetical protein EB118_02055, partial [bacterium]|nr:hypothetical protein [bacterium]
LVLLYFFTRFERDPFAVYTPTQGIQVRQRDDSLKSCSQKAIDTAYNRYIFGSDLRTTKQTFT